MNRLLRLACAVGLHLHRELVVEPDGDLDEPLFIPWWVCRTCEARELF